MYCTNWKGIEALTTHLEHYLIITMILYTEFIRENYRITLSCIIFSVKICENPWEKKYNFAYVELTLVVSYQCFTIHHHAGDELRFLIGARLFLYEIILFKASVLLPVAIRAS